MLLLTVRSGRLTAVCVWCRRAPMPPEVGLRRVGGCADGTCGGGEGGYARVYYAPCQACERRTTCAMPCSQGVMVVVSAGNVRP